MVLVVVRLMLVLVRLSVLRVVEVMIRVSFEVLVDFMTEVVVLWRLSVVKLRLREVCRHVEV